MSQMDAILNDACRKIAEHHLSNAYGTPITLTRAQFTSYCDAMMEAERQDAIESAIAILESNGYRVTKKSRSLSR